MTNTTVLCVVMIAAGIFLVYWSKRRRFNRGNCVGVEVFPSYSRKVIRRLLDGFLASIGYGCAGGAVAILLFESAAEYLVLAFILFVAFKLDNEWFHRR